VFKRKANAKVGKSTTTGKNAKEKTLPLDVGKNTTTNVGKSTTSDVVEIPTAVVGDFPPYNHQRNPKIKNVEDGEPSESESELADSDSDCSLDKQDLREFKNPNQDEDEYLIQDEDQEDFPVEENQACPVAEEQDSPDLDDLYDDEFPAQDELSRPVSRSSASGAALPRAAAALPDGPAPDRQEYADTVYLCSLWWATHDDPEPEPEAEPEAGIDPKSPEHPRNWTPLQRREVFLEAMYEEGYDPEESDSVQLDPIPDSPEADDDSDVEARLIRDEGFMLSLYLEHGRDAVEEVVKWLPTSVYWFADPATRLNSIAELKQSWKIVSEQCDKYYAKAVERGTEERRDTWIADHFIAAGGDIAEWLCYQRLRPVDRDDAAEEKGMDIAEDAYGHDVFSPWVEDDYQAAIVALQAKQAGEPYDADALRRVDWDGYDSLFPEEVESE
jgi:hypothetical protein